MPTALESAFEALRRRADDDPAFADAVIRMADPDVTDPFDPLDPVMLEMARRLNRIAQDKRAEAMAGEALSTSQVVNFLVTVSDRKGVDRRRKRGTLLGIAVGRSTLHPEWQFDRRRRDTWEGLPRVLEALSSVTADALEAHALATASDPAAGGRSIADLLAAGEVDSAVSLALMAGDQS